MLDIRVDLMQRVNLFEFVAQSLVQAQRYVCVFSGVRSRLLQAYLVKRELLCAFAGNVFVVNRLHTKVVTSR